MLDVAPATRRPGAADGPPLDFQQHLAALEAQGLVTRIDRPINKDTELHPLVRWQFQGGPPKISAAPSCSPTWWIRPAAATTCRSRSARSAPRPHLFGRHGASGR